MIKHNNMKKETIIYWTVTVIQTLYKVSSICSYLKTWRSYHVVLFTILWEKLKLSLLYSLIYTMDLKLPHSDK